MIDILRPVLAKCFCDQSQILELIFNAGFSIRSALLAASGAGQTTGRFADVSTGIEVSDIAGMFTVPPAFGQSMQ